MRIVIDVELKRKEDELRFTQNAGKPNRIAYGLLSIHRLPKEGVLASASVGDRVPAYEVLHFNGPMTLLLEPKKVVKKSVKKVVKSSKKNARTTKSSRRSSRS